MKKQSIWQKPGMQTVIASLLAIVCGLLVGSILILVVGLTNPNLGIKGAWEGIRLVVFGLFSTGRDALGNLTFGFNAKSMGNMLFRATPLIMTGLSVALGLKAGLFNIGAPGQYLVGSAATIFLALKLPTGLAGEAYATAIWGAVPTTALPVWLVWLIAFLGGMLAGALWGAIPGLLKATLNINEVLASIMTNWIAASLVTWVFDVSTLKNTVDGNMISYAFMTSVNGVSTAKLGLDKLFAGSQVNGGILVAAILAVGIYILLNRTTTGYEIKACGANRFAARYAGIKDKRTIVATMALAGALAGAGGALYYLAGNTELYWSTYQSLPSVGFQGIPVALLAANNPIGIIFSGCFMAMLNICGLQLRNLTSYNEYITDVIIAVIVYMSALSLVIRLGLTKLARRRAEKAAPNAAVKEAK